MLNNEQIAWIKTNIRNRGIETIDLEHEMIDHISSAVEEKLTEGYTFREAYKSVVNSFGPFGLKKLQNEKYAKLRKKGRRMVVRNTKSYFKLPKIALTFLVTAIVYSLYNFDIDRLYVYGVVFVISVFAPMIQTLASKERMKMRDRFSSMKALDQLYSFYTFLMVIVLNNFLIRVVENGNIYWALVVTMIPAIISFSFFSSITQCMVEIKEEYINLEIA